jgi:nucleolysin TIA-1/TIAR
MTETMMTQSGGYGGYPSNGMAGQQPHMDFSQLPGLDTSQAPGNAMSGSPSEAISAGGTVRRAAPEPNKRALYVGGLDQRVTEEVLNQIFTTAGPVQSVKIIPDKNVSLSFVFFLGQCAVTMRDTAPLASTANQT